MRRIGLILLFAFLILQALPAQAALLNTVKENEMKYNLDTLTAAAGYNTGPTIETTIGNIIKIAMSFLGAIFIILIIFNGINWMRAQGNEEEVREAKKTIKNLIIGLVVIIAAFALSEKISGVFAKILLSF